MWLDAPTLSLQRPLSAERLAMVSIGLRQDATA
jgi:hypothetical protein